MTDTAAFFAKKAKKKAFSFNANKIDASQIATTSVHIDAPAVSSDGALSFSTLTLNGKDSKYASTTTDGGWDDGPHSIQTQRANTVKGSGAVSELRDMKTLSMKSQEINDIVERMRVEETKAALAAAREGTEKAAQKLKEEKESKIKTEQESRIWTARSTAVNASSDVGNGISTTAKWIPSRLRSDGIDNQALEPSVNTNSLRKANLLDESAFPELASTDTIVRVEEQRRQKNKALNKTIASPDPSAPQALPTESSQTAEDIIIAPEPSVEPETAAVTVPADGSVITDPLNALNATSEYDNTETAVISAEAAEELTTVVSSNSLFKVTGDDLPSVSNGEDNKKPLLLKKKKKKDVSTFKSSN